MVAFNLTPSSSSTFILIGIPGLETFHMWISIPFFILYVISLMGNLIILFVVGKEETLHKPMYLLLCIFALTGAMSTTCIMPKTLSIFWFNFKDITEIGCLTQIFFHYVFGAMNSAVLVTMAFDRYVAICDPLRYPTIMTNERITLLCLLGLVRSVLLILPLPVLLRTLSFCASHVIPHTFCENIALVKLSCGDTTISRIYSAVISFVIIGFDLTLIGLSYGMILRSVLSMSSKKVHQKALKTCTTQICVMVVSYSTFLFSMLIQRFDQVIPAYVHILLANLYHLAPSVINPIIYGLKTKEIRDKTRKYICRI